MLSWKWLMVQPGGILDNRLEEGNAFARTRSASSGSLVWTKPPVANVRMIKEMEPLPTLRSSILWRNTRGAVPTVPAVPPGSGCATWSVSRTSWIPSKLCKWVHSSWKGQPSGREKRLHRGLSGFGGRKRCFFCCCSTASTARHWFWAPASDRL